MKTNRCIAAAVLAYCATAAPVNNIQTSADALGPISLLVSPGGIITPTITKNPSKLSESPTNLEEFPIIGETLSFIPLHEGHKNKTLKKQDYNPLDKFLHQKIADASTREHGSNVTIKPPPPVFEPGQGGPGPAAQPPRSQNTTLAKQDDKKSSAKGPDDHPAIQVLDLEASKDVELRKRDADVAAQGLVDDFKNGNLTAARLFSLKGAILALEPENRTAQPNVNDALLSYFQKVVHGIFVGGNCTSTKVQARSINHNHDNEGRIIDDCKIKSEEKTYKEASTIVDHARTRISTTHSESSTEKHKTLDDAADTIKTLVNLPPELRNFYLDELAKLNSTSNNSFDSKTESETSADSWSKTDAEDGTILGSGFEFNSSSETYNKVHEEVVIDLTKSSSIAGTKVSSEIETSKPITSPSAASFSGITDKSSDKSTPTVSSSSSISTTLASNKVAISSSATLSVKSLIILPTSTQVVSSTVGRSSVVSLSSIEPASTSSSSLAASKSTPPASKSSIDFNTVDIASLMSRIREYQSTMSTLSPSATLSSVTSSVHAEAKGTSFSSSKKSIIAPLSSSTSAPAVKPSSSTVTGTVQASPFSVPTSRLTNDIDDNDVEVPNYEIVGSNREELKLIQHPSSTLSSSATSLKTTSNPSTIPTSSTVSISTTSLNPKSSSIPTATPTSIPNDDDVEEPPTHSSSGEPLLPVTDSATSPKRDHVSYIGKLQSLNDAHMLEMQACKHNNTCITETTRRFALAITDLDLDYDLKKRGLGKRGEFEDLKEKAEEWEEKAKEGWSWLKIEWSDLRGEVDEVEEKIDEAEGEN